MKRINWLASYPKSGNTWFRVFLLNILKEEDTPADINRLEKIRVASSRLLFDENAAVESSDLTFDEIDAMRPGIYRQLSDEAEEPFFLKIHDANIQVNGGIPLVPGEATRCVLYFIRNPLDVAVSFAFHSGREIDEIIDWMNKSDLCLCDPRNRLDIQLRQRLLSWSGHVRSWTGQDRLDVHVLKYEDMVARPIEIFSRALAFLGMDISPERVEKALYFSRIEELQRQEQANGFNERPASCPAFFRHGKTGVWRERLSPPQVECIISHHSDVMTQFGYLDENGNPL